MNSDQLKEAFVKFLTARAAREGIDVSGLTIDGATLDSTWGDKCGFVFSGLTAELNERVAKCFEAFASKHYGKGSYDSQRSIGLCGIRYRSEHPNSAGKWFDAHAFQYSGGIEGKRIGVAVSTVYYPCAD